MKQVFTIVMTVICLFSTSASFGQTFKWAEKTGGADKDYIQALTADYEGNLIAGGNFYSSSLNLGTQVFTRKGTSNIFLIKYGTSGLHWAISGGSNVENSLAAVCTDSAGNIYFAGSYTGNDFNFGGKTLPGTNLLGAQNIFIGKADKYGNVQWLKQFTGNKTDGVRDITIYNGQLYITGGFGSDTLTYGKDTFYNKGSIAFYIFKFDLSGNLIGSKIFDAPKLDAKGSELAFKNGYLYCAGNFGGSTFTLGNDTLKPEGEYDFWIGKFDLTGKPIWAKSIGGQSYDRGLKLVFDGENSMYALLMTFSKLLKSGNDTIQNSGNTSYILLKYDTDGKLLWYRTIKDSVQKTFANLDETGTLYLSHLKNKSSIKFNTETINKSNAPDVVSIKFNSNGSVAEMKELPVYSDITVMPVAKVNNGIWLSGYFTEKWLSIADTNLQNSSPYSNAGTPDAFVAYFALEVSAISEIDETTFTVYPNPTNGMLYIKSKSPINNIAVYNLQGLKISEQNCFGRLNTELNITGQKQGIYFVKMITETGISTAKILVD